MSQAKRTRLTSRPSSSTMAAPADPPHNRVGWLFGRRDPSEPRRAEDGGTSFPDDMILLIFAAVVGIANLLRCAATCRRWRSLVSENAISIAGRLRQAGKFIPPLVVGFLQQCPSRVTPFFVPLASSSRRFPALRRRSLLLSTLIDDELFMSSRVVTSRNGLLVVELHRGRNNRALKLCVCNPMTGDMHVLPSLTGKDGLGHYACTVLTAGNHHQSFRLLMLYRRRGFTALRSYSSENNGGGWSPERRVTGAQLSKMQIPGTRSGVVDSAGRVAYWISRKLVFGLRLDTMEATVARLPGLDGHEAYTMDNTLLGMTPEGRLCAVQIKIPFLATMQDDTTADTIVIRLVPYGGGHGGGGGMFQLDNNLWMEDDSIVIMHSFPGNVRKTIVKLQWFCEKSGIVFFTAAIFGVKAELYTVNLSTREVEKIASRPGNCLWNNVYGYEMDEVAYLKSLVPEQDE